MLNFYLYSITAIALAAFYLACIGLANGLVGWWLGQAPAEAARINIATGLGFALVALPVWALHWRWLRRQFRTAEGRARTSHRFFLFTVVCLSALATLLVGGRSLGSTLTYALGSGQPSDLADALRGLLITLLSAAIWLHHWRQFRGGLGELMPQPAPA